jgi:hypothetical protein
MGSTSSAVRERHGPAQEGRVKAICVRKKSPLPSFRGREHSDRRYAPSEHRLRERSPESISAGLQLQWHVAFSAPPGVMDSGLAGRPAKADLPAPRNDAKGGITLS